LYKLLSKGLLAILARDYYKENQYSDKFLERKDKRGNKRDYNIIKRDRS
jgi:hypothetical protein